MAKRAFSLTFAAALLFAALCTGCSAKQDRRIVIWTSSSEFAPYISLRLYNLPTTPSSFRRVILLPRPRHNISTSTYFLHLLLPSCATAKSIADACTGSAYFSSATSSSPFFSFLFNPSEFRHIGLVSKTCLLLFSPFIKRIIPLVRHLHGLLMADMSGTRQHLIKV